MLRVKTQTTIQEIKVNQAAELRRLFRRAVAEDFSYFPKSYRWRVLADNNLLRLAIAAMKPNRILLGAWHDGKLTGYAIAGTNRGGMGKLYWLYVAPEFRRHGVGGQLLDQLEQMMHHRGMRQVGLVTHNYDPYYAKRGFKLQKSQQLYGVAMRVMSYTWPKKKS